MFLFINFFVLNAKFQIRWWLERDHFDWKQKLVQVTLGVMCFSIDLTIDN